LAIIGPSFSDNQTRINKISAGATIDATDFYTVLTNLNLTASYMGVSLGDFSSFTASATYPFSGSATVIDNIVLGYLAVMAQIGATVDPALAVYKYQNFGGF